MAIKEKQQEKKSRIWEILSKEYKWESYLFLIVSVITLMLGILIVTNVLAVKESFPVIGSYPDVFAWILIVFAGFGVVYSIYPFFKPAWPEMKRVSWPSRKTFLGDAIRVFSFLIIFALLFVLYDLFITEILALILGK